MDIVSVEGCFSIHLGQPAKMNEWPVSEGLGLGVDVRVWVSAEGRGGVVESTKIEDGNGSHLTVGA